jgi:histidinol-phosphate aminotransferase
MGLLDYYRQFEDVDLEVINQARRARRRREKELALQRVPDLDVSFTEWPELPNSEVVNASIARARGWVNTYPDRHATRVRAMLAERHEVAPEQIVVGNGASELLQTASLALLSEGDELLMPWPSYPLYPLMTARAGAKPVATDWDLDALRDRVTNHTRVVALCNPNDPTATYIRADDLGGLVSSLPEHVHVLLDEALVHFQDVEDVDAGLRLVDAFPNLVVFRSFSKVYGLSGLRAGYAVASTAAGRLLDTLAPVLGVNALTEAAIEHALRIGGADVVRRRRAVIKERNRLLEALREMPVDTTDSQANFVWLAARDMSGAELTERLRREGVIVAPGGPLGADDHIRATIRDEPATNRFLAALGHALDRH